MNAATQTQPKFFSDTSHWYVEITGRNFGPFDSETDARWFAADIQPRLTYIEKMPHGTLFRDTYNVMWLLVRTDGALEGVYHCERQSDKHRSTFAGVAVFEVIAEPQGVFTITKPRERTLSPESLAALLADE